MISYKRICNARSTITSDPISIMLDMEKTINRLYQDIDNVHITSETKSREYDNSNRYLDIAFCILKREFKVLVMALNRMSIPCDVINVIYKYTIRYMVLINVKLSRKETMLSIPYSPSLGYSYTEVRRILASNESLYICLHEVINGAINYDSTYDELL